MEGGGDARGMLTRNMRGCGEQPLCSRKSEGHRKCLCSHLSQEGSPRPEKLRGREKRISKEKQVTEKSAFQETQEHTDLGSVT